MKSQFKFVESTERKHYMFYIYIIFDFAMAVIMLLFGIWFYRSKGQASNFLSGYNMKSAEERKKYDENAMCKACLLYTSVKKGERFDEAGKIRI